MQLKPGTRLRSATDQTEIIVVKAPTDDDIDLRCGGHPLLPFEASAPGDVTPDPAHSDGTQVGKRYAHAELGLEVLCTKGGEGSLALGDEPLLLKDAKPLPSSD